MQVDHVLLPLRVRLGQPAGRAKAGIVDQDLQLVAAGDPSLYQLHPLLRGEVGGQDVRLYPVGGGNFLGEFLQPVFTPGDQQEVVATARELARKLDAQPGRGAGDQGDGAAALLLPRPGRKRGPRPQQPGCPKGGTNPEQYGSR